MYYWDGSTYYAHDDTATVCETRVAMTTVAASFTLNVTGGTSKFVYLAIGDTIVHSDLPVGTVVTGVAANYQSCTVNNLPTVGGVNDTGAKALHVTKLHMSGDHGSVEFSSLFPRVPTYKSAPMAEMQDADGNKTTANIAFLQNDNIVVGGKTTDPAATTHWVDTGVAIFTNGSKTISLRTPSAIATYFLTWGIPLGTAPNMGGYKGVFYFQATGNFTPTGMFQMFGSHLVVNVGAFSWTQNVPDDAYHAGFMIETNTLVLWNATAGSYINLYNGLIISRRSGATNYIGQAQLNDTWNVVFFAAGTNQYAFLTGLINFVAKGLKLLSTQSVADFRVVSEWVFAQIKQSNTAPLVNITALGVDPEGPLAVRRALRLIPIVHDKNGDPLVGVPVSITSDGADYNGVDPHWLIEDAGAVLTDASGVPRWNYIYYGVSGILANGICAESWGTDGSGNEIRVIRKITMRINYATMPGYLSYLPSRTYVFTLPGLNLKDYATELNAGDYDPVALMPIQLETIGNAEEFDEVECDV